MNVLMVVPWDDKLGGVTSVVKHLAEHLVGEGHGVSFFHPASNAQPLDTTTQLGFPGITMRLPERPPTGWTLRALIDVMARAPLVVFRLMQILRVRRIDVVNVHFPVGAFAYFGVCRRLSRTRLVTSIHGADLFPTGAPRAKLGASLRFLLSSSDLIVAPSAAFLKGFLESFGFPPGRGRAIHNGIDLTPFAPTPEHAVSNGAERIVLSIAQHDPRKGLDTLIKAFARVHAWNPGIGLRLAGDGPMRAELQSLADELQLGHAVEFLGQRSRDDIVQLLRSCEVFVLPSRTESFGIAAVEAMASAKPVIVSRVDGLAEVVEDGVSGLAVPPDDVDALELALKRVLTDKNLQSRLASNGWRRARACFSSSRMGTTYEATFREALGQRS